MLKDQGENKAVLNAESYSTVQLDSLERLVSRWKLAFAHKSTDELSAYVSQHTEILQANVKMLGDLARRKDPDLNARYARLITEANGLRSQSIYLLGQAGHQGFSPGVQMG